MTKRRKAGENGFCRLQLQPDADATEALSRTLAAHRDLLDWLDAAVPANHSGDLVALHRNFYEASRRQSGLPARAVTLAFKDWVQRRRGRNPEGLPLDEKLYGIKGIESVSVATLNGRVTIPFRVAGYGAEWNGSSPARLVPVIHAAEAGAAGPEASAGFDLLVVTGLNTADIDSNAPSKEETMPATETAFNRIGRVIAGMANAAVDAVEGVSPEAIIEQSLREIDAAAEEVKAELGKATAERFRLETRHAELDRESEDLEAKIQTAVAGGRDDLAEAGIARQIDIEAQTALLARLIEEANAKLAETGQTMDAIAASRREALDRLKAFKASRAATQNGGTQGGSSPVAAAMAKVDRAKAVAERLTGVPSEPEAQNAEALKNLHELARREEIQARLSRLKSSSQ